MSWDVIIPFLRPIEALIRDPDISNILVNGPNHVFVEKFGNMRRVTGISLTENSLQVAIRNIARLLGNDISEERPILDARLPDGSRVAAVFPPSSVNGTCIAIRKFQSNLYGPQDLVRIGTLTPELLLQLQTAVETNQNILISGGTGTGKTTLLNALSNFIGGEERIGVIEDTSGIQIEKDNLVRLEARRPQTNLPGVSIRDLLKATLRLRPDRIILGEVRGGEAFDLLQLLNTGHSGTLSTIHANSSKQALSRFTSAVLQSGIELPYRAIKGNVADSLHVVVQVERRPGRRFVSEVLELNSYDADADLFDYCVVYAAKQ